jgi:signal transduction histidine kinase
LITTFIVGVVIVWATAYFFIKELLKPLDVFQELATTISANQLDVRLKETSSNDEINLLSKAFNQMLLRIEQAFDSQKAFTSNASHELRTPLARVAFQIENLLSNKSLAEDVRTTLKSIHSDVHQLSDLVNSLLLLSKFTRPELQAKFEKERIDEIIFKASEQVKKMEPAFELDFEIIANETIDNTLEISGVKSLLEIVFINLLKNACIYSFNKKIKVKIEQTKPTELKVIVSNQGNFIPEEERSQLFQPFFRGTNASNTQGSGLGLRITKRILDYHQAGIEYKAILPYENQFVITFES